MCGPNHMGHIYCHKYSPEADQTHLSQVKISNKKRVELNELKRDFNMELMEQQQENEVQKILLP